MQGVLEWQRVREEIRALRSDRGLTRDRLAKLSGVEQTTIYRIENTKKLPHHRPDFESIEALVVAMGVTLSEFFARIEGLKPPTSASTDQPSPPRGRMVVHFQRRADLRKRSLNASTLPRWPKKSSVPSIASWTLAHKIEQIRTRRPLVGAALARLVDRLWTEG